MFQVIFLVFFACAVAAQNSPWVGQPWGTWLPNASQSWLFPNPDNVRGNVSLTDRGWLGNRCMLTFGNTPGLGVASQMLQFFQTNTSTSPPVSVNSTNGTVSNMTIPLPSQYLIQGVFMSAPSTTDNVSTFTPIFNLSYGSLFGNVTSPSPSVSAPGQVAGASPRLACAANIVATAVGDQIVLMYTTGPLGAPTSQIVYSEVFLNFIAPQSAASQANYTVGMNAYPCTWYGCQLGWFNAPYTFSNLVLCTKCSSPWWGSATVTGTNLLVEFSFQLVQTGDGTTVPEAMIPFLAAMNARVCNATGSFSACNATLLGAETYIQVLTIVVTAQPTLVGVVGSSMTTDSAMQFLSWTTYAPATNTSSAMWGVCSAARYSPLTPTPWATNCAMEQDSVYWGGFAVGFLFPSWQCYDTAGYQSSNFLGPIIVQAGRRSMYYRNNTLLARDSYGLLANPTNWNASVLTVLSYGLARPACDFWSPYTCDTAASQTYTMSHSLMMAGAVSSDGALFYAMADVYAPPTIAVFDTNSLQLLLTQSIMPLGNTSSGDGYQFDGLPIAFLGVDGGILSALTSPTFSGNVGGYDGNGKCKGNPGFTTYEGGTDCLGTSTRNWAWLWRCFVNPATCSGITSQCYSNDPCQGSTTLFRGTNIGQVQSGGNIGWTVQWIQQKCSASYNQPFYHSIFVTHPSQLGVVYMLTPQRTLHPTNAYPNYIAANSAWTNGQTVQYFAINFQAPGTPTTVPRTSAPTFQPEPTPEPTVGPTYAPFAPIARPTYEPFATPTMYPTYAPSLTPSIEPTPVNYTLPPSPGPFNTVPVTCGNFDVYGVAADFTITEAVCPFRGSCLFNTSYTCPPGLYDMQLGPNGRACGGYLRYCTASEFQMYYGATFGVGQPSYCRYMCDVDDPTRCVAMFSVPANWNLPYTQAGLTSNSYAGIAGATMQLTFDNERSDSYVVDQSGVYSDCWRSGGVRYVSGSQCVLNSCLLFNSGASPLDTYTSTNLVECRRNDGLPRGNASFTMSFWFRYQNLTSPNSTMVQFTRASRYSGPVTNTSAAPDFLVVRDLGNFYARYIADYTQAGTIVAVANSTMNSTCNVSWAFVLNPAAANLGLYPPPNCRNGAGVSVPCYINTTIYANVTNCANVTGQQPFNITSNSTFRVVTRTGVVSLGAVSGGFNMEDVLGEWHHYVLTYDGRTNLSQRYLDGVPALVNFSATQPQGPVPSFPNFGADVMLVLGNDGSGSVVGGFQGYMDEFVIFNHTLSASEIQVLYTWPKSPNASAAKAPRPAPVASLNAHQGPLCANLCGSGVQSCTLGLNASVALNANTMCNCGPTAVAANGVLCQAQGALYGQCSTPQMLQYCGVESALACRTRTFWLSSSAATYVSAYIDTSVVNYGSAATLAGAASYFVYGSTSAPGMITDVALGYVGSNAVVMPECLCTGSPSGGAASTGWRSVVAPTAVISPVYSQGVYRARTWLCAVQDQVTAMLVSTLDDAPPVTPAGYCNGVGALSRKFNLQIPHAQPAVYGQLYAYADTRNRIWDTWEEQQQETTLGNAADLFLNISVSVLNPAFFYDSFVGVSATSGALLALGAASAASLVASFGTSALMLPTNPYNCEFYFLQAYCGAPSHAMTYSGTGYCLNPRLSPTVYYGSQIITHPVLQCFNLHNAPNTTIFPTPAVWYCNNYTIGCVSVANVNSTAALRQRWQTPGYIQATNNGSSAANRYSPCDCYGGWSGYSCTVRNCAAGATCALGFADTNCTADGGQCVLAANLTLRTGCVNGVYSWASGCSCDPGWAVDMSSQRCTVPLCNSTFNATCVANGGTCTGVNTCTCAYGRFGPTCDSCFQLPNGVVGGPMCNVPTRNPPCQNNGTAGFAPNSYDLWCNCPTGWGGDDCSIPMCSVVNGSACSGAGICTRPAAAVSNNVTYGPQSPVAPYTCLHSGAYGSCPQALGCVQSTQLVNGNFVIDYTRGGCACQLSAADYCVQPGSNGAICSNRLDSNGCSLCKTRDIFGSSGPLQEMYCDCRDGFSGTYCEVNPCVQPGTNLECSGLASCNRNCTCPLQTFELAAALGVGQYCEIPVPACDFITQGGNHIMCNDATGLVNQCVRSSPNGTYGCVCGNGMSAATKCAYASTATPTYFPTRVPTGKPTARPTTSPSSAPTMQPSRVPTNLPSAAPTSLPTTPPTAAPTAAPTQACPMDQNNIECGPYFPLDGGWVNNMTGNSKHTCVNGQCICNTIYRLNYTTGLCDFICNPATTLSYYSIQGLVNPCVCIATYSVQSNCWNTVCPNTTYLALNGTCQAYPTAAPTAAPTTRPTAEPSGRPTTRPTAHPTAPAATSTSESTTVLIAVPTALGAFLLVSLAILHHYGKLTFLSRWFRCNRGKSMSSDDHIELQKLVDTSSSTATPLG